MRSNHVSGIHIYINEHALQFKIFLIDFQKSKNVLLCPIHFYSVYMEKGKEKAWLNELETALKHRKSCQK